MRAKWFQQIRIETGATPVRFRKENGPRAQEQSSGHPPDVFGTPCGTNRGQPASVPGISFFFNTVEELAGRAFCRETGRCPTDTRPSKEFPEVLCDFHYVPFLLPIIEGTSSVPSMVCLKTRDKYQWTANGAKGKGPRQKASNIVKKCEETSRQVSRRANKPSKSVKECRT